MSVVPNIDNDYNDETFWRIEIEAFKTYYVNTQRYIYFLIYFNDCFLFQIAEPNDEDESDNDFEFSTR